MPGPIEPLSNLTLIKRYDRLLCGTFSSSAASTSSASASLPITSSPHRADPSRYGLGATVHTAYRGLENAHGSGPGRFLEATHALKILLVRTLPVGLRFR